MSWNQKGEVHGNIDELKLIARRIRATCVQMSFDGRHGHLASALSCVDLLVMLYGGFLRVFPQDPARIDRDRFIFSKGHACTSLYAVLAHRGFIPKPWLSDYARDDAPLAVHPCKHALPLLELSTGSLGHGLGVAGGMLYGHRLDGLDTHAIVLMSDGECNEGSVWEAAMFAAAQNLENLLTIIDYNGIQAVGRSDEIMGYTDLAEKFRAFGWGAVTIDGNDMEQIGKALGSLPYRHGRPSAIVAKTKGGAGVPFMEDDVLWHYRVPSKDELEKAIEFLGVPPLHKETA
jgi:transketolase